MTELQTAPQSGRLSWYEPKGKYSYNLEAKTDLGVYAISKWGRSGGYVPFFYRGRSQHSAGPMGLCPTLEDAQALCERDYHDQTRRSWR